MDSRSISLLLRSGIAAVIPGRCAIYCSGAITSGERALQWLCGRGMHTLTVDDMPGLVRADFLSEVVELNLADLAAFTAAMRTTTGRLCINPGAVCHIPAWQQKDWRQFWCEIIAAHAEAVALCPGWAYSAGACAEVTFATELRLPVLNEHAELVSADSILSQMRDAAAKMQLCGLATTTIEQEIHRFQQGMSKC